MRQVNPKTNQIEWSRSCNTCRTLKDGVCVQQNIRIPDSGNSYCNSYQDRAKTDKEYVASPNHCPFCNSENIEGQEWDGDTSTQRVYCNACEKSWADCYKLVGYLELD